MLTIEKICTDTRDVLEFPLVSTLVYVFIEQLEGRHKKNKNGNDNLVINLLQQLSAFKLSQIWEVPVG